MVDRRAFTLGLTLSAAGCVAPVPSPAPEKAPGQDGSAAGLPQADLPPPAPREFRGAWVATVANIDWPSRPGLPAARQQAEMHAILDRAREIGLNALVLQVRPAADALYPSALEPWSEFLSGTQGQPPDPPYDPLATWVQQAHRRGLELHAWFNPYRARHAASRSAPAASHVTQARPGLVRRYGDQWWMDPGEAAAAEHTLAVVSDVLTRYDVDGLHIDDYFYPYPVALPGGLGEQPFPDDAPYERYRAAGGLLTRDDWRRDNVDRLVQALHESLQRLRPAARFGISPFGLGRPDLRPAGIEGFSQYDKLYADVERWIERGWYDYLVPQLYWAIDRAPQAFPVLLDYWRGQVGEARHVWPGLYTSAIGLPGRAWRADEILRQIELTRLRETGGHIHFSMVALMQDRDGIAGRLQRESYRTPALPPASPWRDDRAPGAPALVIERDAVRIVPAPGGETAFNWAVWRQSAGQWRFDVQPAARDSVALMTSAQEPVPDAVVVSAVSRSGQEGPRTLLRLRG